MNERSQTVYSWGNTIPALHRAVHLNWQDELSELKNVKTSYLPMGAGKSYGDSCLNDGGVSFVTTHMNRLISLHRETGVVRCEAGLALDELLRVVVPHNLFIPITLGTKYITVGGAIANDVHGKNHHRAGTFGRHVLRFELCRSDGSRLVCSPTENPEWFRATIAGLGLTGVVSWAEIQLPRIPGAIVDAEAIQFSNLDEYLQLVEESDESYEHTSAWVDYISGSSFGEGIFLRGNFSALKNGETVKDPQPVQVPFFAPEIMLNPISIRLFNWLYHHRMPSKVVKSRSDFDSFFFPLDVVGNWSRLYGRRGFFQYQFVVPFDSMKDAMKDVLETIKGSSDQPYLGVLKTFGDKSSPGLLSFPMKGLTVALDFPNLGESTLHTFTRLDEIVLAAKGRLYPAKDARMAPEMFQKSFPHWQNLIPFVDPKASSSLWRRVTGGAHA